MNLLLPAQHSLQYLPLLLIIDCAFNIASVALCKDEKLLAINKSADLKNHASFLQPAIKNVLEQTTLSLHDVDAVAVVNGPGSFTGLRVGLATAKGICYALQKPLLLLNTLDVMALALEKCETQDDKLISYCPMIDARRQEVYTALYDKNLSLIGSYQSVILSNEFLAAEKRIAKIIVGGSGMLKLKQFDTNNLIFCENGYNVFHINTLATQVYFKNIFADIAYSEPFYIKPAYVAQTQRHNY